MKKLKKVTVLFISVLIILACFFIISKRGEKEKATPVWAEANGIENGKNENIADIIGRILG